MKKILPLFLLLISFGLQAEEHQLNHNGLTLTANLQTASENWTDGTVVLMTHGTLAHNRMEIMTTLQEMLQERELTSLAINLSLGLTDRKGMYDCPVAHTHKHTDALDEIGLWLGWLKKQGVKSVILLGHSRGGNQTAWFAAERDDTTIKKVVLIAPQVWSEGYEARDYQKRYETPLAPLLSKAQQLVAQGKGETLLNPIDFIYCADTSASASAFVAYYQSESRMDSPSLLQHINKPVLVFAGSEDTVVKGLSDKMAAPAERENIHFEVIDGADHFFLDLYAEEVADITAEFIEGE